MPEQFQYLFTPIKLGPVTVRNRIVSTPHGTGYPRSGRVTDQLVAYYVERARGGCGLLELQATLAVPEASSFARESLAIYDEGAIPGYRRLVDSVHEHGAKMFIELFNWGVSHGKGPSALPDLWNRLTAREMTVAEIKEWVEWYGIGAEHARQAGFDGVELHASHGFAIQQFLSPLWNRRTDDYGGPLKKRVTFALEVVDRVRTALGDGMALGVRLDVDDLFPGGNTIEDGKQIAQILESTGKVDYLSVDTALEPHQGHLMVAPMYAPSGFMVPAAAAVKEVLDRIPVITVGRIISPVHAEKILADGHADLVGMTRAQIADPELANKARAGRVDDIRPCLGDNENCWGRVGLGGVMCTGNPRAGREAKLGTDTINIPPAQTRKRVMVVGGGPAGMEAARVAALRGHQVTLYEKTQSLGGQVKLAARLPGRDDIGGITRWLEGQITKLGVEVHLGEEVTADRVRELNPDAVVVATGAAFYRNGFNGASFTTIPGWDHECVVTPEEILSGEKTAGDKVVIVDETGHIVGVGLAELLTSQGKSVQVVTTDAQVGVFLTTTLQTPWVLPRVASRVTLTPSTIVKGISDRTVTVMKLHSYQESTIEGVDTVVLATAKEPNDRLYRALLGSGLDVHVIGDANYAPNGLRGIGEAIRAGYDVSLAL
ncbi:MAG: FAD-dependent oxidoreductase [Chloroflexi bacterium]|nr:FAD-dependent oxidoreductase [Chloroflexota bacterium]